MYIFILTFPPVYHILFSNSHITQSVSSLDFRLQDHFYESGKMFTLRVCVRLLTGATHSHLDQGTNQANILIRHLCCHRYLGFVAGVDTSGLSGPP